MCIIGFKTQDWLDSSFKFNWVIAHKKFILKSINFLLSSAKPLIFSKEILTAIVKIYFQCSSDWFIGFTAYDTPCL